MHAVSGVCWSRRARSSAVQSASSCYYWTGFRLCGEVSEHLLLDSPLLKHREKKKKDSSVSRAPGAVYVWIATLCLYVLQDRSTSPAKTSRPSGKHLQYCVLVPQDMLCLLLPGTTGQVPAFLLGSGTACFERWWHGKQEQMCLWAPLAHLPGTGRSHSSGTAACRCLPLCC